MDNSLTSIFSDKIDKLTYKLYKIEKKILNMEEITRQRWEDIYDHHSHSRDYDNLVTKMRPGHSDYPALVKYNQHNDHRGGGRFSGRLTATHVMGGAIARKLLKVTLGVETHSYTIKIGKI